MSCGMLMGIVMECEEKIIIKYNPRSVKISQTELDKLPGMLCQNPVCHKEWQKTKKGSTGPCAMWANCNFASKDFACTEEDSQGCTMVITKANEKSMAA